MSYYHFRHSLHSCLIASSPSYIHKHRYSSILFLPIIPLHSSSAAFQMPSPPNNLSLRPKILQSTSGNSNYYPVGNELELKQEGSLSCTQGLFTPHAGNVSSAQNSDSNGSNTDAVLWPEPGGKRRGGQLESAEYSRYRRRERKDIDKVCSRLCIPGSS